MLPPNQKNKSIIAISFILLLTSHFTPLTSYAAVSSGSDYSIEVEDIDTALPEHKDPPRIIQNELKTIEAVYEPVAPYTITATNDSFSFSISQLGIDFGALSATNPVVRTSDIVFSTPFYGAQVVAYENHPLMDTQKAIIPDTTCDTGTCSQSIPANWENNLTYGFGFQCESTDSEACGKDFSASNSFKQFADLSAKESLRTIALNQRDNRMTSAKITYKVNISGTQPVGGYSNIVTYIAIPNF